MKSIMFVLICFILIAGVSAETELQVVNKNVDLAFTCTLNNAIPTSASYNITVYYPTTYLNGSAFIDNQEATALGNGAFIYQTNFPVPGLYKVQMFCWDGTYSFSDEGWYEVTPTGVTQNSIFNQPLLIILALVGFGLVIFGAAKGNAWFGFMGALMIILLGVYTLIYGFNNTTDLYTRGIGGVFLGLGFIFLFLSAFEFGWGGSLGDGGEEEEGD
jgi:hypothetical protein